MIKARIIKSLCFFFAITLVLAILLTSFHFQSDAAAADRKVLNFGSFWAIPTLEPTNDSDGWAIVRMGVGETLVRLSKTMAAEPWLAESFKVGDDKLSWTFKIRDGIKFSNGNPLTADAVKKSIERVMAKAEARFTSEFFTYDSITAEGQNLVIKTKNPTPGLPGMLADPFFLIIDVSAETPNIKVDGPICTGPYKITPKTGDNLKAVKNDIYWDGPAKLDEVNFVLIMDPNTRAMALQSGDVDMAANMSANDIPIFLADKNFAVDEIQSLRLVMAFMNVERGLKDENLRKAVKSALDLKTYSEKILTGRFTPGKGPLPPSLGFGFDKLKETYSYNLDKAKAFLKDGGYVDTNGDGYVEKDGKIPTLEYVYYSARAELPLLVEATQNALQSIGIKVNLNQVEGTVLGEARKSHEFDLLIMNIITANTGDPQSFMVAQFETGAFNNSNLYSNPELDGIFKELKTEFDTQKRADLIFKAQQSLIDNPGHIFYAYPNTNIVYNKKILNVEMLPADFYWVTKNIDIAQ
jgi:peptide/nickel transport system substrate-binding protein